jgi:hypothetical protein
MQLKSTRKFLPVLLTIGVALTAITQPAQAGPFGFLDDINSALHGVNSTVNSIKGTQQNTSGTLGNLTNMLGIGQPANNNSSDQSAQLLDIYSKWYTSMTPSDKEIVNWLTTQYAEDQPITFGAFSKTPLYKGKNEQDKPKASATFFKFSEVIKAVGPQKDKFLAFAFCVNAGSTNCK